MKRYEKPTPETLEAEIAQLSADLNAATYRMLVLIREYDASGAWAGAGMSSCAAWLSWKVGLGLHAARERVRVAHALADLPSVAEAFRWGELSYSKARAISRVATAETDDFLLEYARQGTAAQLDRIVRGFDWLSREEALDRNRLAHESRSCSWREHEDASVEIRVRLPADAAAAIVAAIDSAVADVPAGTPEGESEPGLQSHPLYPRPSHPALGRRQRDDAQQPRHAVQPPPPPRPRRRVHRRKRRQQSLSLLEA